DISSDFLVAAATGETAGKASEALVQFLLSDEYLCEISTGLKRQDPDGEMPQQYAA
ncbi:Hypothetical predicted protein, partial [Podarcis lilfordi]